MQGLAAAKIQAHFRGNVVRRDPHLVALKSQRGECQILFLPITIHNSTVTPCGHAFDSIALNRHHQTELDDRAIQFQRREDGVESCSCPTCRVPLATPHGMAPQPVPEAQLPVAIPIVAVQPPHIREERNENPEQHPLDDLLANDRTALNNLENIAFQPNENDRIPEPENENQLLGREDFLANGQLAFNENNGPFIH